MVKLVSREEAIALGLPRYQTGRPCRRGHVSDRRTADKRCCECEWRRHQKDRAKKKIDPAWRQAESDRANRWNKANRDKTKRTKRTYRVRNIQKVKAANARWRKNNPDKVRQALKNWVVANPEKAREYGRRWRAKNALYASAKLKRLATQYKSASKTNRRVRTKGLRDRVSEASLNAVRTSANGICPNCCGQGLLEFDHIVPVAKGGRHVISNIQMLCRACNLDKGARDPVAWAWANKRRRG